MQSSGPLAKTVSAQVRQVLAGRRLATLEAALVSRQVRRVRDYPNDNRRPTKSNCEDQRQHAKVNARQIQHTLANG